MEVLGEAFAEMPTYAFRGYSYISATALRHRRLIARESDGSCVSAATAWCAGLNGSSVRLREEEGDKPCTPKDRLIDCALDVRWVQVVALMSHRSRENPTLLHHSQTRGLELVLKRRLAPPTAW